MQENNSITADNYVCLYRAIMATSKINYIFVDSISKLNHALKTYNIQK